MAQLDGPQVMQLADATRTELDDLTKHHTALLQQMKQAEQRATMMWQQMLHLRGKLEAFAAIAGEASQG